MVSPWLECVMWLECLTDPNGMQGDLHVPLYKGNQGISVLSVVEKMYAEVQVVHVV